jgi:hypothetical protein
MARSRCSHPATAYHFGRARRVPQVLGNRGLAGVRLAIADPDRYAIEPKMASPEYAPAAAGST